MSATVSATVSTKLATGPARARAGFTTTHHLLQEHGDVMTTIDAYDLPPVIDLPSAARLLGIGRTAAYELVRTNAWPTPVLRLGRLIRIPSAPLLELLGISRDGHGAI